MQFANKIAIRASPSEPQGSVASPLLANVYLHYVFDVWAERWRHREARGQVTLVRYADDIVVGFEHQADAERFLTDLPGYRRELYGVFNPCKRSERRSQ
jgi:RNA-directed DNA polymerase